MAAERRRAATFLLAALAWSLGLFALLRSPWAEQRLVLPLTGMQKQAADYYAGAPAVPVAVTGECSGTDVLALCLAAILACPVPWRRRLAAAVGAIALVLALNTVRIATLGHAAASPSLFRLLHLQVWPAILILACASYVFAWMRGAVDATRQAGDDDAGNALASLGRRFVPRAAVLLVAFALAGPWIAQSRDLLRAGAWLARGAAVLLGLAGVTARAAGNVLATSRGAFVVTPECLATALIPLSVAGILAARTSWPRRALLLAAALPVFALLALARLLLLAVPPVLAASPLFLVHGFHQLVLGVAGVALLAFWRERPDPGRRSRAAARAATALGAALVLALLAGSVLATALTGIARLVAVVLPRTLTALTVPGDAQGALALLPAYQAGLLLALGITAVAGWRRLLSAFGVLLASQVALLVVLGALADAQGVAAHPLLLRAWAVGVPVVLALSMLRAGDPVAAPTVPLSPAVNGAR